MVARHGSLASCVLAVYRNIAIFQPLCNFTILETDQPTNQRILWNNNCSLLSYLYCYYVCYNDKKNFKIRFSILKSAHVLRLGDLMIHETRGSKFEWISFTLIQTWPLVYNVFKLKSVLIVFLFFLNIFL